MTPSTDASVVYLAAFISNMFSDTIKVGSKQLQDQGGQLVEVIRRAVVMANDHGLCVLVRDEVAGASGAVRKGSMSN